MGLVVPGFIGLAEIDDPVIASQVRIDWCGVQRHEVPFRRYTEAFEGVFRELAAQHEIPWIEFFLEGVALNPELMQADGIHPNAAAQPILLDNAWPIISQALGNEGNN